MSENRPRSAIAHDTVGKAERRQGFRIVEAIVPRSFSGFEVRLGDEDRAHGTAETSTRTDADSGITEDTIKINGLDVNYASGGEAPLILPRASHEGGIPPVQRIYPRELSIFKAGGDNLHVSLVIDPSEEPDPDEDPDERARNALLLRDLEEKIMQAAESQSQEPEKMPGSQIFVPVAPHQVADKRERLVRAARLKREEADFEGIPLESAHIQLTIQPGFETGLDPDVGPIDTIIRAEFDETDPTKVEIVGYRNLKAAEDPDTGSAEHVLTELDDFDEELELHGHHELFRVDELRGGRIVREENGHAVLLATYEPAHPYTTDILTNPDGSTEAVLIGHETASERPWNSDGDILPDGSKPRKPSRLRHPDGENWDQSSTLRAIRAEDLHRLRLLDSFLGRRNNSSS